MKTRIVKRLDSNQNDFLSICSCRNSHIEWSDATKKHMVGDTASHNVMPVLHQDTMKSAPCKCDQPSKPHQTIQISASVLAMSLFGALLLIQKHCFCAVRFFAFIACGKASVVIG